VRVRVTKPLAAVLIAMAFDLTEAAGAGCRAVHKFVAGLLAVEAEEGWPILSTRESWSIGGGLRACRGAAQDKEEEQWRARAS
jgi:hypothetical protein